MNTGMVGVEPSAAPATRPTTFSTTVGIIFTLLRSEHTLAAFGMVGRLLDVFDDE